VVGTRDEEKEEDQVREVACARLDSSFVVRGVKYTLVGLIIHRKRERKGRKRRYEKDKLKRER
jgi:hypothetical protein